MITLTKTINKNLSPSSAEKKKKRPRAYEWRCANESVRKTWRLNGGYTSFMSDTYPELNNLARSYALYTTKSSVVLQNEYGKEITVKSTNRFSPGYQRKIENKLNHMSQLLGLNKALFVVLTVDPNRFSSLPVMHKQVSKSLNKMFTGLRSKIQREARGCVPLDYLRTYETQENGMLHVNLILFNVPFIPKEWFMRYWSSLSSSGFAVELKLLDNTRAHRSLISYASKYITKNLCDDDIINKPPHRDVIIGWACGWRSYSVSMDLLQKINDLINAGRLGGIGTRITQMKWSYVRTEYGDYYAVSPEDNG